MDSSKIAPSPPPYSPQFQNNLNPIASSPPIQMIHLAPPPYPGTLPMNIDNFNMSPQPQTCIPEAQNNMNSTVNTAPPPMYYSSQSQPMNVVNQRSQSSEICPKCQAEVKMRVKYHSTAKTYAISGLFCLSMLWPCVCLPCLYQVGYKLGKFCPHCFVRVGDV
ncbi:uncharacterized protein LOC127565722 [Drosophila albomicans]|uniref:Uncharacterized protein LOC127565722 n=1 Tax=Drosophila albomicans TaxID=7291 RepID=A0A9C6T8X8_DROAB|nr:uncharacterized protein LOC127565722 [Drosophila albomicans]